jgi:cytochrome bd-type quinol oxidase subunit 2
MEKTDPKKLGPLAKVIRYNYLAVIVFFTFMSINLILFSNDFAKTMKYVFVSWWFLSSLFIVPGIIYIVVLMVAGKNKKGLITNLLILILSLLILSLAIYFAGSPNSGLVPNW